MQLTKFFDWLVDFFPHMVIVVAGLVLISLGFFVVFQPGPIVAAITLGELHFRFIYALLLFTSGGLPIYALSTRNTPLMIKTATFVSMMFLFLVITRLVAVGLSSSLIILIAITIIIFLSRMTIWWVSK